MLLLRSFIVGLAVAAPVGPIGMLVIKRSLTRGGLHGFVTGLGAASADALFALAAALGLGAIVSVHGALANVLRITGALFLCFLAARTFLRSKTDEAAPEQASSLGLAFATTLLLTLSSPVTILSFAAIATSLGVQKAAASDGVTLVVGVFLGSTVWWAFLSAAVGRLKKRIPDSVLRWLDRGSAVILGGFGIVALLS